MKLISHRGNINGSNPSRENTIEYITECIVGYDLDVEVDITVTEGVAYLAHDSQTNSPINQSIKTLLDRFHDRLWIHCKNIRAIEYAQKYMPMHNYFGHSHDDFVLTSKGYIFTKPSDVYGANVICVMPEIAACTVTNMRACFGVLTDYPLIYKTRLDE